MSASERTILHLLEVERDHLQSLARRLCRNSDDASDLVQETWIRALTNEHRIPDDCKAQRAWLATILRNVFRSQWRKQKVRRLAAARPDIVHRLYDPKALAIARNEREVQPQSIGDGLAKLIDALPDNMREPLLRVDLHEESYAETASALGWPLGTVMSRLHRARQRLRGQLDALRCGPVQVAAHP